MPEYTHSYPGNAQPRMTNVIPIEPANANSTNLQLLCLHYY